MNDTEKRALFCRIDSKLMQGMDRMAANVMVPATDLQSLRRLAAAVPPKGYVLVPVEPTEEMIEAICNEHGSGGWPQGYGRHAQHIRREHAGEGYRAALAARPEVSGG